MTITIELGILMIEKNTLGYDSAKEVIHFRIFWADLSVNCCLRIYSNPANLSPQTRQSGEHRATSVLTLVPEASDHLASISCHAKNPKIQGGKVVSASATLEVHFE